MFAIQGLHILMFAGQETLMAMAGIFLLYNHCHTTLFVFVRFDFPLFRRTLLSHYNNVVKPRYSTILHACVVKTYKASLFNVFSAVSFVWALGVNHVATNCGNCRFNHTWGLGKHFDKLASSVDATAENITDQLTD